MRTPRSIYAIAILSAWVAGCSNASIPRTAIGPAAVSDARQHAKAAGTSGYVYISDVAGNFIDKFDASSGALVEKITNVMTGPGPLYVDSSGNLWVGLSYGNGVMMIPEGTSAAPRRLQDGGSPAGIVIGADGTAYVSNALNADGSPGSILVYPPGRDTPARTIQDPGFFENSFITIDDKGDLFVTGNVRHLTQFIGRVDEYVGARQTGLRRWAVHLYSPGGVKWFNGNVYVCDNGEYTVTEYTESGKATGRKLVTGGAWDGIDILPDGKTFAGADQTNLQGISRAFPFGRIVRTYTDPAFINPVDAAYQTNRKGL